ncbi:hypothetical protein [Streptomyces sp. NPDC060027]|uniref:hypothetical protein n=1 Tax=Streptomyces sp. NPDC060027 TaxID=3347040 RepID=UPI00367A9A4E
MAAGIGSGTSMGAVGRSLVPASAHRLQVTVSGRTTTMRVDGTVTAHWTSQHKAADITGGIGLRVGINHADAAWPSFSALAVKQLPGAVPGPATAGERS